MRRRATFRAGSQAPDGARRVSEEKARANEQTPFRFLSSCVGFGFVWKNVKGVWWMPWRMEAMKDVLGCEKPGGAAKKL